MRASVLFFASCSAVLVACADGTLPSESNLDRLRVLAAQAEPPEAGPGDLVTLSSLTYAPDDADVGVVWELCMGRDCPSEGPRSDPAAVLDTGEVDLEAGVVGLEPDLPPAFVIPDALLDSVDEEDLEEGTFLRFGLSAVAWPDGDQADLEWATKDLVVSTSEQPNENPVLEGILVDGEVALPGDILTVGSGEIELAVDGEAGLEETYTYVTSAGVEQTRTEELSVAWYTDVGTLEGDLWTPGNSDQQGVLIVVVRDGRGGTDWASFPVQVD